MDAVLADSLGRFAGGVPNGVPSAMVISKVRRSLLEKRFSIGCG